MVCWTWHWNWGITIFFRGRQTAGAFEKFDMWLKDISIESKNNKTALCSECNAACGTEDLFTIDNRQVCRKCLFGNGSPVTIYPIGIVNNNLERDHTPFGRKGTDTVSKIELLPSQKRFMAGLDHETKITIIYYLHKSRPVKTSFKRGIDGKQVGVFASRTPDRLSRIGIQDVRLLDIKGTTLFVKGLDAVSGTPVLDIKLKIWLKGGRQENEIESKHPRWRILNPSAFSKWWNFKSNLSEPILQHHQNRWGNICRVFIFSTFGFREAGNRLVLYTNPRPAGFSLTGILADISSVLAKAEISIFAISTFDTDYILVKSEKLQAAKKALQQAEYRFKNLG